VWPSLRADDLVERVEMASISSLGSWASDSLECHAALRGVLLLALKPCDEHSCVPAPVQLHGHSSPWITRN
jgi:hypothetical protein